MSPVFNVAVLVGSLRKASITRRMADALADVAPPALRLEQVDIGHLELYNQDYDDEHRVPAEWAKFRQKLSEFDAALFVTPEYNRSVPAVLKNAIDVGSRPYGQSVWQGKPAAVVSVSPGTLGAFGANHHLRQSLVFLDMPTLQAPEAYVGGAAALFNEAGELANEKTRAFLSTYMTAFAGWIARAAPELAGAGGRP
jgi:chromate reductase